MKYKITSIRHSKLGNVGDVVELEDISNIPFNSKLELVEDKKVEVRKKVEENPFKKELVEKVGFSEKRADKVVGIYKTKEELLKNKDKLPFEKVEVEAIMDFYKEKPKKTMKKYKED